MKRRAPSHRGGKPLLTHEEKLERQRALARVWRERNREKLRLYFAEYRSTHPELKVSAAAYHQQHKAAWLERARRPDAKAKRKVSDDKNRARIRAGRKAWGLKNPERQRGIERRGRERNRVEKRLRDRRYRQEKPEIYKASIARAKAAKPELYRAIGVQSSLRRRARKRELVVEPVSLKRILSRDGGRCHLCLQAISGRPTVDHLIPILRSGAHAEWNLMLAHDRCNKSRGTKSILTDETKDEAERYIAARLARYAQETV